MRGAVAFLVVMALGLPAAGWAQTTQAPAIDVSKMGVSLDRIRRQLAPESTETFKADGLKLNIRVDVFGQAPAIELFPDDFSLTYGPVPNSAPTHREHIDFVTPQEFRSPAVPVYGLAVWAAQKLADRSKKARCEEEIEAYRVLVMQGVSVAAPRCTQ
jgi:hypothetical protein